jgi:hypothetical protein
MNEDEMGRACSMHAEEEIFKKFQWENLKDREHLLDLEIDLGHKIKMDLKGTKYEPMALIYLTQDRHQ